ncbi:hypothetical protein NDU88_003241 [Pleurodeles waltl]|uniref:Uncharacterized protein n=1 Tax=Pleurodeles waltl TaxID=8319 RepID=A0AAV7NFU6_PLEWA|nr:hypothetical protein NDU88_003241 [Pleurodeles waltl]
MPTRIPTWRLQATLLHDPPERLEDFFQEHQITHLTAPQLLELQKPIEMHEIREALRQLAHNKAPGGDGLASRVSSGFLYADAYTTFRNADGSIRGGLVPEVAV